MPKTGYITGSLFSDMLTGGRGSAEWGKTSLGLAREIAAQRLGWMQVDLDGYTNEYIEWGNEQEPKAIDAYERETFTEVHSCQEFQQHPDHEWVGVHPDGLIGEDGAIEVKCPKTANHLWNVQCGGQVDYYKYQLQGTLWVTGRGWIDFVSYDPRLTERQLYIERVKRDEDLITEMEERYLAFEQKVTEIKEEL